MDSWISKDFIGKATIFFFFFLPNSNILQYFFHLDADNEANVCFFFFLPGMKNPEKQRIWLSWLRICIIASYYTDVHNNVFIAFSFQGLK